jgi:2-oxoisovalerate dehydrogenase E1 component beta subunit
MPEVTLVDAINLALARALADDPDVVVFGEDVGVNGGVFRATAGLQQRFGAERVFDTPLSEVLIGGLCVGMAAQGLKPVGEIQFMGFLYPCIDQLVNHASRLRNRTQGRLSCPMVLRTPHGAGIRAPEHHSEATEAMLAHIPGLRVVVPSVPERAYGLLLAAIRDPDPVVFLEPTRIYRSVKGEVEDTGEALPLDVAFVVREGRDITLISWGAMVKDTLEAADELTAEDIDAEVIDLATLKPYDGRQDGALCHRARGGAYRWIWRGDCRFDCRARAVIATGSGDPRDRIRYGDTAAAARAAIHAISSAHRCRRPYDLQVFLSSTESHAASVHIARSRGGSRRG